MDKITREVTLMQDTACEANKHVLRRVITRLSDSLGMAAPSNPGELGALFAVAQEARWGAPGVTEDMEIVSRLGHDQQLPSIPHCGDCAAERSPNGDVTSGFEEVATPWFVFLFGESSNTTDLLPSGPIPLGSCYASCSCGWKMFADNEEILDKARYVHDPGDSCCACAGLRCLSCVTGESHARCIRDCPECCQRGADGLTQMERQRTTAHRYAAENDEEAFAFLDSLISAYGHITHKT